MREEMLIIVDEHGIKRFWCEIRRGFDPYILRILDYANGGVGRLWRSPPRRLCNQDYYNAHQKIQAVLDRPIETINIPRSINETSCLKVKNAYGMWCKWTNALKFMDKQIHMSVRAKGPMSEQELFDRHNEIYKIVTKHKFKFM